MTFTRLYSPLCRILSCIEFASSGCWLWQGGSTSNGYGRICLRKQEFRVHRFMYELLIGPMENQSHHSCKTRRCVNPWHIRDLTPLAHIQEHYRSRSGEQNGRALLTEQEVLLIRVLRQNGNKIKTLKDRFGVSKTCILDICARRTWRNIGASQQGSKGRIDT